jgi:hypothetical protein
MYQCIGVWCMSKLVNGSKTTIKAYYCDASEKYLIVHPYICTPIHLYTRTPVHPYTHTPIYLYTHTLDDFKCVWNHEKKYNILIHPHSLY